jgi:hypothetical protein
MAGSLFIYSHLPQVIAGMFIAGTIPISNLSLPVMRFLEAAL